MKYIYLVHFYSIQISEASYLLNFPSKIISSEKWENMIWYLPNTIYTRSGGKPMQSVVRFTSLKYNIQDNCIHFSPTIILGSRYHIVSTTNLKMISSSLFSNIITLPKPSIVWLDKKLYQINFLNTSLILFIYTGQEKFSRDFEQVGNSVPVERQ